MKLLSKAAHDIYSDFYTGTNGNRTVNCILDTNCVRFIVIENGKSVREFNNAEKDKCFSQAEKALNK